MKKKIDWTEDAFFRLIIGLILLSVTAMLFSEKYIGWLITLIIMVTVVSVMGFWHKITRFFLAKEEALEPKNDKSDDGYKSSRFSRHYEKFIYVFVFLVLVGLILTAINYDFGSISLPWLSNKWIWIILVTLIVVRLAIKFWPKGSGLLSFDKAGRVLVTKRAKKPWWILVMLAGAFIVLMTMFVLSAPWKVLRWENHTANIEGSSEKKAGSGVVKINATNYFQANEPKKFRVITNVTEQWETPIEENDVITLTFEGQGENWSYQVWKNKGTVYYKDIKIRKLPFSDGVHTVRADKNCRILMTSAQPASIKRI